MSQEEKYEEKVLRLLGTIAEQTKPRKEDSSKPAEKTEETHKHWKAEELVNNDCPECKAEVEKIGKGYMKKVLEERKDSKLVCKECGTPVREEEKECPTCGSKEAKHR